MATTPSFNVGRDGSAVLIWNGVTVTLPLLTEIRVQQRFKTATSTPLYSPELTRELPSSHEITVMFDRADNSIEMLAATAEAGFWNTGSTAGGTGPTGALFLYITETNGATTTRNYQQVAWKLSNSGSFTQDAPVKMEMTGTAARMVVM